MSALVTIEAVRTSREWPLTRPLMSFDAGMAAPPLGMLVGILLADDLGWEWIQAHPDEAIEVARQLRDATKDDEDPLLWRMGSFDVADASSVRLVTRGYAVRGTIKAAILDVDKGNG